MLFDTFKYMETLPDVAEPTSTNVDVAVICRSEQSTPHPNRSEMLAEGNPVLLEDKGRHFHTCSDTEESRDCWRKLRCNTKRRLFWPQHHSSQRTTNFSRGPFKKVPTEYENGAWSLVHKASAKKRSRPRDKHGSCDTSATDQMVCVLVHNSQTSSKEVFLTNFKHCLR